VPHIERRPDRLSTWRVKYRDPGGRVRSRSFRRRAEAELFAATVEVEKAQGTWVDPVRGKIKLCEWTEEWLKSKVDLRPTSRARIEGVLRAHVLPAFGHYPLLRISNSAVRRWVSELVAQDLSAATVRKSFGALAQMTAAALSDRRIPFDPCQDVPLPAERHSEQRYLTAGQVDLIANEIDPRLRALVFLAAYGGLRFGELAGLRRRRVDLLRGRVVVIETLVEANGRFIFGEPKTQRSRRTVPIPRRVVVELDNHLQSYVGTTPDALVFTGEKGAPLRWGGFPPLLLAAGNPEGGATGLEGPRASPHLCGSVSGCRCQPQGGVCPSRSLVSCVHP
jgi:integrase